MDFNIAQYLLMGFVIPCVIIAFATPKKVEDKKKQWKIKEICYWLILIAFVIFTIAYSKTFVIIVSSVVILAQVVAIIISRKERKTA